MIKATRVGRTIVCVIQEKMYQKVVATDEELMGIYEQALNTDESDQEELDALLEIFIPSLTREEEKIEEQFRTLKESAEEQAELLEWLDSIRELGDPHFQVKELKLYMKGINITIPEFLAVEFAIRRENEEDLNSLMNFWKLCALNSDPRCREFLINNDMVVTPSGYFLAYRNANVKNGGSSRAYVEFISQQYTKIKGQKKSPKNYDVVYSTEYEEYTLHQNQKSFIKRKYTLEEGDEFCGDLQILHDKLSDTGNVPVYTDAHSGVTRIVIGETVSIPRDECDADPDRSCSRGLHLGSTSFMTHGYFGSVGLVCLCNPMHVVAVPYADGQKLRTSEYLPIGIAEYGENGRLIPIETATFEYDYAEYTQEQLDDMISEARFESLKEHQIIPKEIDLQSFKDLVQGLAVSKDEMKRVIESRVHNI